MLPLRLDLAMTDELAKRRADKQRRCATRGHRFPEDGKGTCLDCGLTVNP